MKPGDIVRVVMEGHFLKGELGLIVDTPSKSPPFSGWFVILVGGREMKMPPSWIRLVSEGSRDGGLSTKE